MSKNVDFQFSVNPTSLYVYILKYYFHNGYEINFWRWVTLGKKKNNFWRWATYQLPLLAKGQKFNVLGVKERHL